MFTLDKDKPIFTHQSKHGLVDEARLLKSSYSPPMLISLDSDSIAGGQAANLHETTSASVPGFLS